MMATGGVGWMFKRMFRPSKNILDDYVKSTPGPQNALDIFVGQWSSTLPEPYTELEAGKIPLFNDDRLAWGIAALGGVKDRNVLELGPLEGGHSYMLERMGAASVLAIESNTRAYLKCLITKELLKLKRVELLCGDFVEYLRSSQGRFDLCVASGVLYHMQNPVELIELLSRTADRVYLWSHYYDGEIIGSNPILARKFHEGQRNKHAGFAHTLFKQDYKRALAQEGFCGGNAPFSNWLHRDDLLACLQYFGFKKLDVNYEVPEHPNGPCLAVAAEK